MKSDPVWIDDFSILFNSNKLTQFFPTKSQTNEERINSIVRLSLYISIMLAIYHSNIKYCSIFVFFLFFTFIIFKHSSEKVDKQESQLNLTKRQQIQLQTEIKASEPNNNKKLNNFIPSLGLQNSDNIIENLDNTDSNSNSNSNSNTNTNTNTTNCTVPTVANPFMNFTMADYMTYDNKGSIVDRTAACDASDPNIKAQMDKGFNNNLFKDVNDLFGKGNSQRQFFTMPWTNIVNDQENYANYLYNSPMTCKENQENCLQYEDIRYNRQILPNALVNPNNTDAKKSGQI